MTRRQILTVRPRPDLKRNKLYRVRIQRTHIKKKTRILDVTVQHVDPGQVGRPHNFRLDLPLYPDSPASQFLVACGLDADQAGNRVSVGDAVGRIIGMVFCTEDFDETGVIFERVPQLANETDGDADTQ
jgi:hypothetical protein